MCGLLYLVLCIGLTTLDEQWKYSLYSKKSLQSLGEKIIQLYIRILLSIGMT